MFLGIMSIANMQLAAFIVFLLSFITKLIFYFRIKTKRSKSILELLKSYKTWYRIHDLHDVDNNLSRQDFMQVSNVVNIIWYIAVVLLMLSTIMNSNYFS